MKIHIKTHGWLALCLSFYWWAFFCTTLHACFDPNCSHWTEEKDVSYNYLFCNSKIATLSVGSHPQAFYIGFYNFLFSQMYQDQSALFPIYNSAITPPGPFLSHFTIASATYDEENTADPPSHEIGPGPSLGPQYVAHMTAININHTDLSRVQSQVLDFSRPNDPQQICRMPQWSCRFLRIQMEMNAPLHLLYYLDPCSGDLVIANMTRPPSMTEGTDICDSYFDAYASTGSSDYCSKTAALAHCSSLTIALNDRIQSFVVDQTRMLVFVYLSNRTMTILDGVTGAIRNSFHYFTSKELMSKMVYDSRRMVLYAASAPAAGTRSSIYILDCKHLASPALITLLTLPRHRSVLDIAVNRRSGYFHYLTRCPSSLLLPYTWVTVSPDFQVCRDISTGEFDPTSFVAQGDYVYFQGQHRATGTYVAFRFHFKCCHKNTRHAFQLGVHPPIPMAADVSCGLSSEPFFSVFRPNEASSKSPSCAVSTDQE